MSIKKADYIAHAIARCETHTQALNALLQTAVEAQASAADASADERDERAKAVKSAKARVNEHAAIVRALADDALCAVFFAHRIDFDALCSEKRADTRECRKRLLICARALAAKSVDALENAEARYFAALAAKRLSMTHTLAQARDAMKHETEAQARYMRDFCEFARIARASSERKQIAIDEQSSMLRALLALFA